ncbi:acyltransferase family protein [Cupriavidus sp. KB_39]|jgi:exopolysaccharide production protein ExoZ|uniref:acyltransferase family protein n=1 Tax=Cupriavidus sp. KB_39 TaxID=3233036 RepID=UPI003F8E4B5B
MITNLQLVRALAALAVVFYHTGYVVPGHTHTELQGVAIFFALSGFLMAYLSQTAPSARDFFDRRVVRIVPLYWVVTVFSVLWFNYGLGNPVYQWPLLWQWAIHDQRQLFVWLTSPHGLNDFDLWARLFKSLFFVPYKNDAGDFQPLLGVGWTLNLEMFFYFVFSIALMFGRKSAPIVAATLILAVKVIDDKMGGTNPIIHFYAHDYTWNFVYGIASFYVWRLLPSVIGRLRLGVLLGALVFTAFFVWVNFATHETRLLVNEFIPVRWAFIFMPVVVVFSALILHSAGARVSSRLAILLGDASYAIYLSHTIVIGTLYPVGQRWAWMNASKSVIGVTVAMMLSTILGVLVYLYVEKPLLNWIRERRRRRKEEADASVVSA